MAKSKSCHICRQTMTEAHSAYPLLCPSCGTLNENMKLKTANLSGRVALVTGGRIKVGQATVLRLLRNGAHVIATTRFPWSAMQEYASEPDFETWKDRLMVLGLDLMRIDLLGDFIQYLSEQITHLDLLINNAAQTVKDDGELERWQQEELLLQQQNSLPAPFKVPADWNCCKPEFLPYSSSTGLSAGFPIGAGGSASICIPTGANDSSKTSQFIGAGMSADAGTPALSKVSSSTPTSADWVKKSADVSLHDLLSVQIINVTAPYLLAVGLRELLEKSPYKNHFIVNVSSLEGKFSVKKKSSSHPHTNMAKAALNMMTKTLAQEYRKHRIYVYSIDPGWVSKQFPKDWRSSQDYLLPLGFDDSAARLTQPLFDWAETEAPKSGIFLKDYFETEW